MQLKNLYQKSLELSDNIFQITQFWSNFCQTIIGFNLQKSADSISINLGKIPKTKDKLKQQLFTEEATENTIETLLWLDKARRRKIINKRDYQHLYLDLKELEESFSK